MKKKYTLKFQQLNDAQGNPASEIQLFKMGEFEHWSGETFKVDQEFIESMIVNFESMKSTSKDQKIIPLDYNHGSLSFGPEEGKAAGWVVDLFSKEDGLYAKVEWTAKASEYIKNGEYRYISPEFSIDVTDEYGEDVQGAVLYAAALTNRPFLKGMSPVTLSAKGKDFLNKKKENEAVNLKEFAAALGLSEGASEKEVGEAIKNQNSKLSQINEALKLNEGESIVDGIKRLVSERDQSKTEVQKLSEKVEKLNDDVVHQKAIKAFEDLQSEGKAVPAMKESLIKMYKKDTTMFSEFTATLPKIFSLKSEGSSDEPIDPADSLEKAVEDKMKTDKIGWSEAYKIVCSEKPELAKAHADKNVN